MTAGPWVLTNSTRTDIIAGNSQTGSGYSVALFTSAAGLATTVTSYASLTNEVANANGYTTGGVAVSLADTGTTSVAVYFAASPGNPTWTATGGSIVARWAVLYNRRGRHRLLPAGRHPWRRDHDLRQHADHQVGQYVR